MTWDRICAEALGFLSMPYNNPEEQAFACDQARIILLLRAEAETANRKVNKVNKVNKLFAMKALGALWARS